MTILHNQSYIQSKLIFHQLKKLRFADITIKLKNKNIKKINDRLFVKEADGVFEENHAPCRNKSKGTAVPEPDAQDYHQGA